MSTSVEKTKSKIERMMTTLAKEQAKLLAVEKQQRAKEQREKARQAAKEKALIFRQKDAHRKIVLGGLIIAAEVDLWNEAEIVGALLLMSEQFQKSPDLRDRTRDKGIKHLLDREEARKALARKNGGEQ